MLTTHHQNPLRGCPGFPPPQPPREPRRRNAFTLVELLVAMAMIALLAALLLPVLSATKARGKQTYCLNNLHQLGLAMQMYAADNSGRFADNQPASVGGNSWVYGNMQVPVQSTNLDLLRQGELYAYITQPTAYWCPADPSRTGDQPRARSYSMNGWIGSRYMETYPGQSGYRTFIRESELATVSTAEIWVMIDEHESSIDDGWFLVTMDDSRPFASYPATRHQRGYGWNFVDGHAAPCKLQYPEVFSSGKPVGTVNSDWLRLKQATTTH